MKKFVLNDSATVDVIKHHEDISQQLKGKMDNLKLNFFDLEKGGVNYDGMRNSDAFEDYKAAARELAAFDLNELTTRQGKLAFWINVYNALVVHGVLELNVKKSVKDIPSFFKAVCYNIGGHIFSLDDIEHGILRGNKKKHLLSGKPFSRSDPRNGFALDNTDPRIHFALVCGSNSCPPIEVYEEEQIDEQLDLVSDAFINSDDVSIAKDKKELRVSKIFKWYKDDFGGKKGVVSFIIKYRFDPDQKAFLETHEGEFHIAYKDYDWSLNLV